MYLSWKVYINSAFQTVKNENMLKRPYCVFSTFAKEPTGT